MYIANILGYREKAQEKEDDKKEVRTERTTTKIVYSKNSGLAKKGGKAKRRVKKQRSRSKSPEGGDNKDNKEEVNDVDMEEVEDAYQEMEEDKKEDERKESADVGSGQNQAKGDDVAKDDEVSKVVLIRTILGHFYTDDLQHILEALRKYSFYFILSLSLASSHISSSASLSILFPL